MGLNGVFGLVLMSSLVLLTFAKPHGNDTLLEELTQLQSQDITLNDTTTAQPTSSGKRGPLVFWPEVMIVCVVFLFFFLLFKVCKYISNQRNNNNDS